MKKIYNYSKNTISNLIEENTSPLFRIMYAYNSNDPTARSFNPQSNICAFHIGHGIILTVAHHLESESLPAFIKEQNFVDELLTNCSEADKILLEEMYVLEPIRALRVLQQTSDANKINLLAGILKKRYGALKNSQIEKIADYRPQLILQSKGDSLLGNKRLAEAFDSNRKFHESVLNRNTFLVELELVESFPKYDISLYKVLDSYKEVIKALPFVEVDFSKISDFDASLYCLQSSPGSELGRMLNKAQLDGIADHFAITNPINPDNLRFEGPRYLIKGYFRFGSSGAPYLIFDQDTDSFKVTAIQSEACGIQMDIGGNRGGNMQFTGAIATPLYNVQAEIEMQLQLQESLVGNTNA